MPLHVQKQGKESPQNLIRRFIQKVRKSGILLEVRKKRFKEKPRSRHLEKQSALRREEKKKEYERLRKMGK